MIYKGRSIYADHNTAGRVTQYLLHNTKNERVVFLGARGTAFPDDLEKSIDQMIWRAEESKSKKPLYFAILSPDLAVDKDLTEEEWEQIRYTQAKNLGLEGQPFAWVQHEKFGDDGQLRIHRHVIYQRYDTENERIISDEFDRRRNAVARAEIEIALGHERTFQRYTLQELEQIEAQRIEREKQEREAEAEQQRQIEAEKLKQQEKMRLFLLNSDELSNEEKQEMMAERFRKIREQARSRPEQGFGHEY